MMTLTQAELLAEARDRFGDDPLDRAFQCPNCGDIATGRDFTEALTEHPRNADRKRITASDILGQECIGRTLGALAGPPGTPDGHGEAPRGCDWYAYGLIPAPWTILLPDGRTLPSFPLAPAGRCPVPTAVGRFGEDAR